MPLSVGMLALVARKALIYSGSLCGPEAASSLKRSKPGKKQYFRVTPCLLGCVSRRYVHAKVLRWISDNHSMPFPW